MHSRTSQHHLFRLRSSTLAALLLCIATLPAVATTVSDTIHGRILAMQSGNPEPGNAPGDLLPSLYAQRDYAPAWSNPHSVRQLIEAIEHSDLDGLEPSDYNLGSIRQLLERSQEAGFSNPDRVANLDLLLTNSLIRLGHDLAFGKVDPVSLDADWDMTRNARDLNAQLLASNAIETGRVDEFLRSLRPQSEQYEQLRQALARYRAIRDQGGWEPVPEGPSLKPDMIDERVPAVRARLASSGDLSTEDLASTRYDESLTTDVARFQRRHGLGDDGVVGTRTIQAMNIPVQARIDQIRANLERARWVLHDLPDSFLLVDIADFTVRLYEDRSLVWQTRAVVGQPYRMSPVLRSTLTYLDINPTWTVPPTVLRKDVLPELRRDPGYLEKKNMQLIDHQGHVVSSAGIDWSQYNAWNFPWLIRQQPGPQNALGRVKFMFPNSHSVYLHDTPSKSLFKKPERAFSSGCIRIENPLDLAEILLQHNDGWDRERLDKAVRSMQTRSVNLAQPIEIILMYWTVGFAEDGSVLFNQDIYGRDPPLIHDLVKPANPARNFATMEMTAQGEPAGR